MYICRLTHGLILCVLVCNDKRFISVLWPCVSKQQFCFCLFFCAQIITSLLMIESKLKKAMDTTIYSQKF